MIVLVVSYNSLEDGGGFPVAVADNFSDAKYRAYEHNVKLKTGLSVYDVPYDTLEQYKPKWDQIYGGMRGSVEDAFYDIWSFEVNASDEMNDFE